ncbi:MAG: hypothetical protein IMF14_02310, partial [Proteobacteria bacterium]|nr:hypothetical protein [Pseudomonadota bacterium]
MNITHRAVYFSRLLILSLLSTLAGHSFAGQSAFTKEDFSHWLDDAYIAQATY